MENETYELREDLACRQTKVFRIVGAPVNQTIECATFIGIGYARRAREFVDAMNTQSQLRPIIEKLKLELKTEMEITSILRATIQGNMKSLAAADEENKAQGAIHSELIDALNHALHDSESRLHMMPLNVDDLERAIIEAQINIYRAALLKAGVE